MAMWTGVASWLVLAFSHRKAEVAPQLWTCRSGHLGGLVYLASLNRSVCAAWLARDALRQRAGDIPRQHQPLWLGGCSLVLICNFAYLRSMLVLFARGETLRSGCCGVGTEWPDCEPRVRCWTARERKAPGATRLDLGTMKCVESTGMSGTFLVVNQDGKAESRKRD